MILKDSILVSAQREDVWPFVADPVGMASWNSNIVVVERDSDEPVHLGEEFDMVFRLSAAHDHESQVEVVVCRPPREVQYRHNYVYKGRNRSAEEQYQLEQQGSQVLVTQAIDLSNAGIPWPFRLLMRFISKFGTTQGMTSMEKLKVQVEKVIGE